MTDELSTATPVQAALGTMDKIVVAIHGVGSQQRSETIRRVSFRFGQRTSPPMALMPLGFFHVDKVDKLGEVTEVKVSQLENVPTNDDLLKRVGFAEVFWADIPQKVDKANDTLEEIKDWGRTVVSRAEDAYRRVDVPEGTRKLGKQDFALGAAVIEEIVETVAVLENLFFIAEKMGLFKFDLAPVLREYVGDVQVVAEFKFLRDRIVYRFHKAMHDVVKGFYGRPAGQRPEVYVVAHSEGTVVSFLAMLQALSSPAGTTIVDPDDPSRSITTDWIEFVRGYMTIGSPIDKHLVLWPHLWDGLDPTVRKPAAPIEWRNYYDYGDPIGFKLDTAVAFLKERQCSAFAFDSDCDKDDFGFSRYWLPGKAHNDYWGDAAVFEHFIRDVVMRKPGSASVARKPEGSHFVDWVSTSIPYLLSAALHLAAVFVLFKAVTTFLAGDAAPMFDFLTRAVFCLGGLLLGVSAAARVPRLVHRGWRWSWLAIAFFALTAWACWRWLPSGVAEFFGGAFTSDGAATPELGRRVLLGVALLVASTGWWLPRKPGIARRTLIGVGTLAVLAIVVVQIWRADVHQHPAVWPLVLAGAAFLYLWWLGILVFDLAFVWHRYIRSSAAVETLGHWYRRKEAEPRSLKDIMKRATRSP